MKIKNLFALMVCFLSSLCGAKDFYIVDLSPSYDVGFFSAFNPSSTNVVSNSEYTSLNLFKL